jgi:hypothetical protein
MKTIVIYSPDNEVSVAKVKDFRARHPKFEFLTVDDTDAIKLAKAGVVSGNKIIELDKPKKAKASTGGDKSKTPTVPELVLKALGKKSMTSEEIVDALPKANSGSVKSAITRMVKAKKIVKTVKGKKTTYKKK